MVVVLVVVSAAVAVLATATTFASRTHLLCSSGLGNQYGKMPLNTIESRLGIAI